MNTIYRFANLIDVSQLKNLANGGAGEALRNVRLLAVIVAVAMVALYGFSVGRARALISLLALYAAYTLTILFPFLTWAHDQLPVLVQPVTSLSVFIIFYIVAFLIFSDALPHHRSSNLSSVAAMTVSVAQLGLMGAMGASLLPPELAQYWLGPALIYLAGPRSLFVWAALTLGATMMTRSRASQ